MTGRPHVLDPWQAMFGERATHLGAAGMNADQVQRVLAAVRAYRNESFDHRPPANRPSARLIATLILTLPPDAHRRAADHAGFWHPVAWSLPDLLRFLIDPDAGRPPTRMLELNRNGWRPLHPEQPEEHQRLHAVLGHPPGGTYQYLLPGDPAGGAQVTLTRHPQRWSEAHAEIQVQASEHTPMPLSLERDISDRLMDTHREFSRITTHLSLHRKPVSVTFSAAEFTREYERLLEPVPLPVHRYAHLIPWGTGPSA